MYTFLLSYPLVRTSPIKSLWSIGRCLYSTSPIPPSEERDLLHHSPIPTDHFQKSLPRLKVPKLEASLQRYLATQEAFLSESNFSSTRTAVDEFQSGPGPQLQSDVEAFAKANKHTSYVTDLWFDMYLRDRRPVVLTHNPVMIGTDSALGSDYNKVDIRATNMIYSALRMMRSYRANELDPDVFHLQPSKTDNLQFRQKMRWLPNSVSWYGAYLYKAFPLDNSQFVNLFNSTRIPEKGKDRNLCDPNARHLLVINKEKLYVFDILDDQGHGIQPEQILANIRYILAQPARALTEPPGLGNLTTMNRDRWADIRQQLVAMGNEAALLSVDTAAFALVLDDCDSEDIVDQVHNLLHGPGGNRWFDKSLSLLMTPKGRAAVNFEHSWGDGVAVLRFFNEVWRDSDARPVVRPGTGSLPSPNVREVKFQLDDNFVRSVLLPAKQSYDEWRDTLQFTYRVSNDMGKVMLKQGKLGPDSMMQLSFQLAYYKLHSRVPASYESCSTSAFKHGRTETIRPATVETRHFTQLVLGRKASIGELQRALTACSDKHNKLTREAAMGEGWDRHLFVLRNQSDQSGSSLPALYKDEAYTDINQITVSTSTLFSPYFLLGGFAAVTSDGYGVGYGIRDQESGLAVTSWRGASSARADHFADAFEESLKDIKAVVEGRVP